MAPTFNLTAGSVQPARAVLRALQAQNIDIVECRGWVYILLPVNSTRYPYILQDIYIHIYMDIYIYVYI